MYIAIHLYLHNHAAYHILYSSYVRTSYVRNCLSVLYFVEGSQDQKEFVIYFLWTVQILDILNFFKSLSF